MISALACEFSRNTDQVSGSLITYTCRGKRLASATKLLRSIF
jgi:hypothetical protein